MLEKIEIKNTRTKGTEKKIENKKKWIAIFYTKTTGMQIVHISGV